MKNIEVYGTKTEKVFVDPIDVVKRISIGINIDDWIIKEKDGTYTHWEDQGRFDNEVGKVSKEIYELFQARKLLIEYLKNKKD